MQISNKKGIGLEWYFLYLALFLGFVAFFISYSGPHKIIQNYIGQYQFSVLSVANRAEKSLFYIDQSAKYSMQQAVYDLARNGGISEIEVSDTEIFAKYGCERFNDAFVWYQLKKTDSGYSKDYCFDEKTVNDNLIYSFNKNLNQYFVNYPGSIPTDNYNYELKNSLEIIGAAIHSLKFDILKDEAKKEERTAEQLKDPKQITKDAAKTQEGLRDFTGTPLCAKGSTCILTEEAFQMVIKAQEKAIEKGALIEVYSAYRSPEQQKAFWEGRTSERYAQRYPDVNVRSKYVCDPSNGATGCPHLSGNVVDVKLKGNPKLTNRDLHSIMASAGWVKYKKESWHFECCGTNRYTRAKAQGVTEIV